jgi:outer membrane autotransporter protein
MANKPKFLKNLLTTASAFSVLAIGATEAMGAPAARSSNANNYVLNTGANLQQANAPFVSGSSLQLTGGHSGSVGAALTISAFDTGNNANTALVIDANTTLGSVVDTSANGNVLALTINAGQTLTLSGTSSNGNFIGGNAAAANTYTGLGNITFAGATGTFATQAGTGPFTLTTEFTNPNNGTLQINNQTTFTKAANAAKNALSVNTVAINAGGYMIVDPTGNNAVTVSGTTTLNDAGAKLHLRSNNAGGLATYTLNGGAIRAAGDGVNGILIIEANGQALTVAANAAETIGTAGGRLAQFKVTNSDSAIIVAPDLYAKALDLDSTGDITFNGAVDAGAGGSAKITGAVTDVIFNGTTTFGTAAAGNVAAAPGQFDFNNNATTVKVADTKTLTANLIGDATNGNTNGTLFFVGSGKLDGTTTRLALIRANAANGVATLSGAHIATDVQLGNATAKFLFKDGFDLTGSINNGANSIAGIVQFEGSGHVSGNIGANTATGNILVSGGAGKVVKLDGDVKAAAIVFDTAAGAEAQLGGNLTGALTFTTDGTLTLINDANHTITGAVTTALANGGTINANALVSNNKALTVNGAIGAAANQLTTISATGGGNLVLTGGDAYVKTIDMGNSAGNIVIGYNPAAPGAINYQVGTFANAANATLVVGAGANAQKVNLLATANNPNQITVAKVQFLVNGDTLNFADGLNLTAAQGVIANAGVNANLIFDGAHVIDAQLGLGAGGVPISSITVTTADATKMTLLKKDVYATALTVDNNATVQLMGNVTAAVDGKAANQGTVEFVNTADTKLTGAIGGVKAVSLVKISGGNVEIAGAVTSQNGYEFGANSKGTLTLDTGDLANNNVTVGGNKVNSIVVKNAQNITGNIGTAANQLATIKLDNGAAQLFTVRSANFFSGISFAQNNLHNVALNAANVSVSSIGDNANAANSVTFLANGAVGDTYSKTVVVNDGITATFNGALNSSNGTTLGSTANGLAIANFADGAVINTTVDTLQAAAAAGKLGTVNFAGGAAINQALGATQGLAAINFNGQNKVVQLGANIKATTITLNQNTLSLTGNATVDGKIVAANSSFALANNTLTVQNGATSVTGASTISTIFDGSDYGKIVVSGAGNKLDFTGANVTVNIHDSAAGVTASRGKTITIGSGISNGSFILPDAAVSKTVSELGPYVVWNYVPGSNGQFTSAVDLPNAFVNSLGLSVADANILGDERNTGDAAAFADRIAALDLAGDKVGGRKAVDQMNTIESSVDQLIQSVLAVNSTVAARVADVTAPNLVGQVDLAENTGVAAGDNNAASYGVWGTPFYSQATQSNKAKTPGYKSTSYGVTVGFDTRANDTMTVGAAVSVVNDTVKYKGSVASDKSKSNTYMFSVYGMQQLTDNWFLQGTASFGSSSVKNTAARLTKTATGKYDSMTYGGQLLAGYHVPFADTVMLTPMGGLKYNKFNDTGYKETGADFNRTVSKKSVDKLEGVIGARATFFTEMNGVTIIPGMHGFVNYDFLGKKPNVTARIDGLNANSLNTNIAKPERAMYNVGLSVKATYNMMEYGAGYDAYFTKKYAAHQGSLKVRVNF